MVIFGINYILDLFEQKEWTTAHDFDQLWTIFDLSLIILIFGINYILDIFEQNAWTIAHVFDRFLTIFDP